MPPGEALEYVRAFMEWPVVEMTPELVLSALSLAQQSQISPWDAAILEAARQSGCRKVISEDMGAGQAYRGVFVENPF